MMKKRSLFLLAISFTLLLSCATLTKSYRSETEYRVKRSSRLEREMSTVKFKTDRKGKSHFELRSPLIPQAVIYGSYSEQTDASGDRVELHIEKIRLFANWPNGWTEAKYEASGKIILTGEGEQWRSNLAAPIELWDIVEGEIRYYDTFYRGEDGLGKVKNRVERLSETAKLIKEKGFLPYYGHIWRDSQYSRGFKKEVGRFLFPELYGFKKLEREGALPAAYYESSAEPEGSKYSLGANLLWRRDYTLRIFPEHFHELRDSGALYRDYEEAGQMLFLLYNLEYYSSTNLNNELFREIVKER